MMLPDEEARHVESRAYESVKEAQLRGDAKPFADLLPATQAIQVAHTRHLQQTNTLRVIEALRIYAAEHGHWPEQLDEIKAVPVPLDPVTNKPFDYSVKDGVARINLSSFHVPPVRYEVTLRPSPAK
jgi:hypothetical protein